MRDKPINLGLNAFLKLAALNMPQQMTEVTKRVASETSGYDYYRPLRRAIKAFINNEENDKIYAILLSSPKESEKEYNKSAFESFVKKFARQRKKLSVFNGKATLSLAKKRLIIRVEPIFVLETREGFDVYHIWATQKPELKRHLSAMGCYICNEAFHNTRYANYNFKLFDAVAGRIATKPTNASSSLSEKTAIDILHWVDLAAT